LAFFSIISGYAIGPLLFGGFFGNAIEVAPYHDVLGEMGQEFRGVANMMLHAPATLPFWLAVAGIGAAVYLYLIRPGLPAVIRNRAGVLYTVLERKYGFDELYSWLFAGGARWIGTGLWKGGDVGVIDGVLVNGSARLVGWTASAIRYLQSGYIYHYAFAMIIGLALLLLPFVADYALAMLRAAR
jgi:NADH-quinone oxidoreductase subunit L